MVSPSFGIPPAPQCARCLWAALHISPNCLIYNILSFPIKEGWMSTAVLSILLFAQQMYEKYSDRRRKSQGGKKRRVESLPCLLHTAPGEVASQTDEMDTVIFLDHCPSERYKQKCGKPRETLNHRERSKRFSSLYSIQLHVEIWTSPRWPPSRFVIFDKPSFVLEPTLVSPWYASRSIN